MSKPLPENVALNLDLIKPMGAAQLSKFINLRAGRTPLMLASAQSVINQFNLIESELEEGKMAAAAGDLEGVRDAICDIVLLAFGQEGHIDGLNLDADFKTMCAYNMTRIPQTIEEAEETKEKYKKLGIETEAKTIYLNLPQFEGYLYPVVCVNKDQWDSKGNHYPPNKFVKSVKFQDAAFETIEGVAIEVEENLTGLGNLITEPMVDLFLKELSSWEQDDATDGCSYEEFIVDMKTRLVGKRA